MKMFSFFSLHELLAPLKNNKARTILTGFSVAWGIFILIILLGVTKGVQNGILVNFENEAKNSIWIYSGITNKNFKGLQPGRQINLTKDDYLELSNTLKSSIEKGAVRLYYWNHNTITYKSQFGKYNICFVNSGIKDLTQLQIIRGRFISENDIKTQRKVISICYTIKQELFNNEEPIGKYVKINNISYLVIGVHKSPSEYDNHKAYIPISVGQMLNKNSQNIDNIGFLLHNISVQKTKEIEVCIRKQLSRRHDFDDTDNRAIWIRNSLETYEKTINMFSEINIFVFFIGIGTLIAGIMGVSNIMLIVVFERKKEIGVRKAIGATPFAIVSQIVIESVLLTSVSGYIGLITGIGVLEFINRNAVKAQYFKNPSIDLRIALLAVVVLIICGTIGGYIPAKHAAGIKPVDALKDE